MKFFTLGRKSSCWLLLLCLFVCLSEGFFVFFFLGYLLFSLNGNELLAEAQFVSACVSLSQTWNRRESLLQVMCFREVEKGLSSSPATVQKPSFALQLLYLNGLTVWSCGG